MTVGCLYFFAVHLSSFLSQVLVAMASLSSDAQLRPEANDGVVAAKRPFQWEAQMDAAVQQDLAEGIDYNERLDREDRRRYEMTKRLLQTDCGESEKVDLQFALSDCETRRCWLKQHMSCGELRAYTNKCIELEARIAAVGNEQQQPKQQPQHTSDSSSGAQPQPEAAEQNMPKDAHLSRDVKTALKKFAEQKMSSVEVRALHARVLKLKNPKTKARYIDQLQDMLHLLECTVVNPLKEHVSTESRRVIDVLQGRPVEGQDDIERIAQIEIAMANLSAEKRAVKARVSEAKAKAKAAAKAAAAAAKASTAAAKPASRKRKPPA